ncbi:DeoR/GlpR family DNA-binding transcription regulator [Opitutus sp. ER46]|uniref:DeoR/GlpR family DNA-binding transcription regulator n=1 Tax=Opitutus sp. ER46 TaxID=2161864 RepID=UPI000D31760F|nr:DeoR/GlpR family DNA-binding transcription regulator [Opitutus sp. ER46]PTX98960.1 DeoR/GlpR transcriptional regulator [Opitutus sp. ER46]
MTNKQRTDLIEKYIRKHTYADLHTLATEFGGSLSTVRRALDLLEARGIVRRHHGGASLIETDALAEEYDFLARNKRQVDAKFAISALVAEQVKPGMTVILDGGTTTYTVARLIAGRRLQVVTNSLPVASLFGDVGTAETTVTGGNIYGRLGVLLGPTCEQAFDGMHADLAILGGAGITENGIWNQNALIVSAQRKMIAAAERVIFAVDKTKFGRKALNLTAPFDARFTIVTDTLPEPAVVNAISTAGATLTLAEKVASPDEEPDFEV